jgi:hypothetical protein
MLVHVVCFKYRTDVDAAARHDHRARLLALGTLECLVDLKVGEDVVRSSRSYDTGLVVFFQDRQKLEEYAVHPGHVPVAQFGASLCESIVSADFEA